MSKTATRSPPSPNIHTYLQVSRGAFLGTPYNGDKNKNSLSKHHTHTRIPPEWVVHANELGWKYLFEIPWKIAFFGLRPTIFDDIQGFHLPTITSYAASITILKKNRSFAFHFVGEKDSCKIDINKK